MARFLSSLLQRLAVISVGFGDLSVPPSILELPDDVIEEGFQDAAHKLRDKRQRLALVRLMAKVPGSALQNEVAEELSGLFTELPALERILVMESMLESEPSQRLLLARVLILRPDIVGGRSALDALRHDSYAIVRLAAT